MTKTGHCVYCLRPLAEHASSIEPSEILRISDFQRTRESLSRPRYSGWMRMLISVWVGILLAFAIVGIFGVCLRWLAGLLTRGVRQT